MQLTEALTDDHGRGELNHAGLPDAFCSPRSARLEAAVDVDRLASETGGVRGGEEGHQPGDVLAGAEPPQRNGRELLRGHRLEGDAAPVGPPLQRGPVELRVHVAGADAIDPDPVRGELPGDGMVIATTPALAAPYALDPAGVSCPKTEPTVTITPDPAGSMTRAAARQVK